MSKLRVLDPSVSDSFETALRRFFAPVSFEADTPALKMRVDVSEKDNAYLAQDVDDSKVLAKYADGVLTLELPKKASAESRKITVQQGCLHGNAGGASTGQAGATHRVAVQNLRQRRVCGACRTG